jgi:2,3-dihydroxy-p-cumate/2,3-dihydroxybenzoate 3,4-dioxygenase
MIPLIDIRYVRLGTADVNRAVEFCTGTVGLELVRREGGRAYLRGDGRDHNIVYFAGDPKDHTLGLEIEREEDFRVADDELRAAGVKVERSTQEEAAERRVMDFLRFRDPSGNKIELVHRPFHSGTRYFPSRDAGICEFSHVGLKTTNPKRDERFWTSLFNFRVNDWIGPAPLMSFDHIHHRIALFPTTEPGVQHINFQVEGIDVIMRSWYFFQERQVKIMFGPGRHPSSSAMFLYYEGPDGVIYEYSHGVRHVKAGEWRPRQFPFDHWSFCMWGAKPAIKEFDTERPRPA